MIYEDLREFYIFKLCAKLDWIGNLHTSLKILIKFWNFHIRNRNEIGEIYFDLFET